MKNSSPLMVLNNLKKWFPLKSTQLGKPRRYVHAVNNISMSVNYGETLGIVGESGCGKSTLGRTMVRLYEPTNGQILYKDKDITHLNEHQMRPYRKDLQIIFQDPYSSLDPRMTVGDIIAEPFVFQKLYTKKERIDRVQELMKLCGLDPIYIRRYPHEFSGGQRQRIGIARALALTPSFMMCDEPVSALDVSIQSQIINLLMDLQQRTNLTYAFISHNLNVVYHISDRIAVMYLGFLVELADKDELYFHAAHPYTKALLESIPNIDFGKGPIKSQLTGDLPSPVDLPNGCPFASRCTMVQNRCKEENPTLREIAKGHQVACHFV